MADLINARVEGKKEFTLPQGATIIKKKVKIFQ